MRRIILSTIIIFFLFDFPFRCRAILSYNISVITCRILSVNSSIVSGLLALINDFPDTQIVILLI